jgi:hypothetical protein
MLARLLNIGKPRIGFRRARDAVVSSSSLTSTFTSAFSLDDTLNQACVRAPQRKRVSPRKPSQRTAFPVFPLERVLSDANELGTEWGSTCSCAGCMLPNLPPLARALQLTARTPPTYGDLLRREMLRR